MRLKFLVPTNTTRKCQIDVFFDYILTSFIEMAGWTAHKPLWALHLGLYNRQKSHLMTTGLY